MEWADKSTKLKAEKEYAHYSKMSIWQLNSVKKSVEVTIDMMTRHMNNYEKKIAHWLLLSKVIDICIKEKTK